MVRSPRPVTVITGFLGAGKTTLINTLLRASKGRRFGVIVNEFGSVGIDGRLIETTDQGDQVYELSDGCLCCALQGELTRLVARLAKDSTLEHLLIETSGAADPVPVLHPFLNQQGVGSQFQLDATITVVDALNWQGHHVGDLYAAQIRTGDFLVLSKLEELGRNEERTALQEYLLTQNPDALQVTPEEIAARPELVLNTDAFDLDRRLGLDASFLDELTRRHSEPYAELVLQWHEPLGLSALEEAMDLLAEEREIYRAKGILALAGEDRRGLLHGVNNRFHLAYGPLWNGEESRRSELVLIGTGLQDPGLKKRLRQELKAEIRE